MNYQRVYDNLILRAKNRISSGYVEVHHITPRCIGGGNQLDNLVSLTPEEHFLAHLLLVKIFPTEKGLVFAAHKMCQMVSGRPTHKLYGWIRRKFALAMSEAQTGSNNSQFGLIWITNGIESKKILNDTVIPIGWERGRKIPALLGKLKSKRENTRCRICDADTNSKNKKYCSTHLVSVKKEQLKRAGVSARRSYQDKLFITDGIKDKLHPVDEPLPNGFRKGRATNGSLTQR